MPRKLRMILNTFISGPQAWFFVADDRGYFRAEGLEIEFTPGDTAANAVPRVASGEFDVGYGDMNALIEMAGAAAGAPPDVVGIYATFTQSPYTICVPAASGIVRAADLAGKRLASHPNDAAMKMWPEFARAAGLDPRSIAIEISSLHHREILRLMLDERRWDGVFGFVNTLRSAAIEARVDADRALRHLEYAAVVPDLYGAVVLARRTLAIREPDAVAGFVRAVRRGVMDVIADIDAAIDAVARRDPAIDRAANRERLTGTLALEMAGSDGDMDDARLARAVDLIAGAKGLPRRPAPGELFMRRFVPV